MNVDPEESVLQGVDKDDVDVFLRGLGERGGAGGGGGLLPSGGHAQQIGCKTVFTFKTDEKNATPMCSRTFDVIHVQSWLANHKKKQLDR